MAKEIKYPYNTGEKDVFGDEMWVFGPDPDQDKSLHGLSDGELADILFAEYHEFIKNGGVYTPAESTPQKTGKPFPVKPGINPSKFNVGDKVNLTGDSTEFTIFHAYHFNDKPAIYDLQSPDKSVKKMKVTENKLKGIPSSTEIVIDPNTDTEFDEQIYKQIEPHADWQGNLIKERIIKKQIHDMLTGPQREKEDETQRLFNGYNTWYNNKKETEMKADEPKLHPYIAFYKGEQKELHGKDLLDAKKKAVELFKAKKPHLVSVHLATEEETEEPTFVMEAQGVKVNETYPHASHGMVHVDSIEVNKGDKKDRIPYLVNFTTPFHEKEQQGIDGFKMTIGKKEKTLGQTSHGAVVEYADQEGEIIQALEEQGEMTTSDAQGLLEANEAFAREKYGLGIDPADIAKKILAKGEPVKPTIAEIAKASPNIIIAGMPKYWEKEGYHKEEETEFVAPNPVENAIKSAEGLSSVADDFKSFQGINYNYKNQYALNKAIEALLEKKLLDIFSFNSDEKNFLRKYSGYGGLDKYGVTGKGGLFEYYTPRDVIERMWALAYKYGYDNGSVCEPSCAIGDFFQFAKPELRMVGYELSRYSALICKILYPTAEILNQPFEQAFIKRNFTVKGNTGDLEKFDLVIGNPPYGDFSIVESRYMSGMGEKDFTKAHNYVEYFIRRGVDLLKPGGLLIYIVGAQLKNGGTLFLDSGDSPVKEYLAKNTKFLDAYRLPDSIFERTGVTSDIIVLQKL